MTTRREVLIGITLLGALAAHGRAAAGSAPTGTTDILTEESYWRVQVSHRKPLVTVEAFKAAGRDVQEPVLLKGSAGLGIMGKVDHLHSPLPPQGWSEGGFDDSSWPRTRPGWMAGTETFSMFSYCLRGRFEVTNPSAVSGLRLTLAYRGGAVVYLNGQEVTRAHMPGGELGPETPAEPYPDEAYLDAKGKVLPRLKKADEGQKAMIAERVRVLGPVEIPVKLLRKGVNVLAVEVRRSDYHPAALKWFGSARKAKAWWKPVGLEEVRLLATGSGIEANVSRPEGIQVWVHDRDSRVTASDYGDPNEELGTVKLVGARNGTYLGQVAIGSPRAFKGARAEAGALKAADAGGGEIPASAIDVFYGLFDYTIDKRVLGDGMSAEPPAEVQVNRVADKRGRMTVDGGAVLPVMVRVRVPGDAQPGDYRGTLTVRAGGETFPVPVELNVADWTLPDSQDFRTHTSIYTSPTTISITYKVDMWSEKHWKLMEKSWEFLGRAGNELVVIPAVEETQFGNKESMIRYVRNADGSWGYDFSIFDRYLDLAEKHCGKLDHVAVQIWHAGGWSHRAADNKCTVTVVDAKGAAEEHWQVPPFGTEESRKFWSPLLLAVQARLEKRGMKDALCVGILSDSTAPAEVLKGFDEIFPAEKCNWMRGCHSTTRSSEPYPLSGGLGRVVLHEFCYGTGPPDPDGGYPPIWTYAGRPGSYYKRVGTPPGENRMNLARYHTFAERALLSGTKGIGRICVDYWYVFGRKEVEKEYADVYNLYPHSTCAQRRPNITRMCRPGPEGAEPTARFEAMIEGIQEVEAVIYLGEAAEKHAARLGKDLEERIDKLLHERFRREEQVWRDCAAFVHPPHLGWQELARRTYELCAEVSGKLGK